MSEALLSKPNHLSNDQLAQLNADFVGLTPTERIQRSSELFAGQIVVATTFGPTAPVLLKHLHDSEQNIPTINIMHGHETEETIKHASFYTRFFNLDVNVYKPNPYAVPNGRNSDTSDLQWRAKIEPFGRALNEHNAKAYISGAMAWQTDERKAWSFVEKRGDVLAIYPLIDVSRAEVDEFFESTGLPRNIDYYDPTKGADQKRECRLNTAPFVGRGILKPVIETPAINLRLSV